MIACGCILEFGVYEAAFPDQARISCRSLQEIDKLTGKRFHNLPQQIDGCADLISVSRLASPPLPQWYAFVGKSLMLTPHESCRVEPEYVGYVNRQQGKP